MRVLDENDRYHRHSLITWWDQERLRGSRVLVVGAGALGNEVAKNLALVGTGTIEICDMDLVEHSNLARCVFFSEDLEGKNKALALAAGVKKLNSDVTAVGHAKPVQRLGVGFVKNFDLVIGALDNREARLWVNQACRKWGIDWIDGAIEGLRGVVRIFGSSGACYACTLTEADYQQLSHRQSCALLAPEEILEGKTPTNATTASIVAGVQSQEAIKSLTGNDDLVSLRGKVWSYTGDSVDVFTSNYQEDEFCLAHDCYETVVDAIESKSARDLLPLAKQTLPDDVIAIDFEEDVITLKPCASCGTGEIATKARSSFREGEGRCDRCGTELLGEIRTSIEVESTLVDKSFEALGLALLDVITIRSATSRIHFLVTGVK